MNKYSFDSLFWILYAAMIAIPWHQNGNSLLGFVSITSSFNVIHIFGLLLFIYGLLLMFQKGKIRKSNILVVIFLMNIMWGEIIGNSPIINRLSDSNVIIICISILVSSAMLRQSSVSLISLLNYTKKCMNVNCIINIFMYITKNWSFWQINYASGRFGGGYFALLIITAAYSLYIICTKRNEKMLSKKLALLSIVLAFYGTLISAVRTNILVLVIVCIVVYFITIIDNIQKSVIYYRLIIAISGFIAICVLLYGNSYLSQRLNETTSLLLDNNIGTRMATFLYYIPQLIANPNGFGFGYYLHFVWSNGIIATTHFSVDNSFLYIALKCGVLSAIVLFVVIIIKPINSLRNLEICSKYKIGASIVYLLYLFSITIMTNQAFYSYANAAFLWTFCGICISKKLKI